MYFLAQALQGMGGRRVVELALHDLPANRKLAGELGLTGINWLPWVGWRDDVRQKRKLLREGSWNLVHSIGVGVRIFQMGNAPGGRRRRVYDFDEHLSTIRSNGLARRLYHGWVERFMLRQGHAFTCASEALLQWVRGVRPDLQREILYLPVAISPQEHREDSALMERLRRRYRGRRLLLYVGTLTPMYRDQVEEIFSLAIRWQQEGRGDPPLILALGGGVDLEFWRQRTAAAGLAAHVEFPGFVPRAELASHLAVADALLFPFPPTEQNLGRCPTKAFHYAASGRPLVTNDVGEVGRLFGASAYYYPSGNLAEMSAQVDRALRREDPRPPLVFDSLTWEARARTYSSWLDELPPLALALGTAARRG